MDAAAQTVEEAGSRVDEMIRILARSRQVELEITSEMFGTTFGPRRVSELKRDIEALQDLFADTASDT